MIYLAIKNVKNFKNKNILNKLVFWNFKKLKFIYEFFAEYVLF
jgi:hypothetical protein